MVREFESHEAFHDTVIYYCPKIVAFVNYLFLGNEDGGVVGHNQYSLEHLAYIKLLLPIESIFYNES